MFPPPTPGSDEDCIARAAARYASDASLSHLREAVDLYHAEFEAAAHLLIAYGLGVTTAYAPALTEAVLDAYIDEERRAVLGCLECLGFALGVAQAPPPLRPALLLDNPEESLGWLHIRAVTTLVIGFATLLVNETLAGGHAGAVQAAARRVGRHWLALAMTDEMAPPEHRRWSHQEGLLRATVRLEAQRHAPAPESAQDGREWAIERDPFLDHSFAARIESERIRARLLATFDGAVPGDGACG